MIKCDSLGLSKNCYTHQMEPNHGKAPGDFGRHPQVPGHAMAGFVQWWSTFEKWVIWWCSSQLLVARGYINIFRLYSYDIPSTSYISHDFPRFPIVESVLNSRSFPEPTQEIGSHHIPPERRPPWGSPGWRQRSELSPAAGSTESRKSSGKSWGNPQRLQVGNWKTAILQR